MDNQCCNCMYFDGYAPEADTGFCRRFAPRPKTAARDAMTESDFDVLAWWPVTMTDDWCGEFEPRK